MKVDADLKRAAAASPPDTRVGATLGNFMSGLLKGMAEEQSKFNMPGNLLELAAEKLLNDGELPEEVQFDGAKLFPLVDQVPGVGFVAVSSNANRRHHSNRLLTAPVVNAGGGGGYNSGGGGGGSYNSGGFCTGGHGGYNGGGGNSSAISVSSSTRSPTAAELDSFSCPRCAADACLGSCSRGCEMPFCGLSWDAVPLKSSHRHPKRMTHSLRRIRLIQLKSFLSRWSPLEVTIGMAMREVSIDVAGMSPSVYAVQILMI